MPVAHVEGSSRTRQGQLHRATGQYKGAERTSGYVLCGEDNIQQAREIAKMLEPDEHYVGDCNHV